VVASWPSQAAKPRYPPLVRRRVPPLLLLVALACAGERSEVGDTSTSTSTGPEPGCFGCSCTPDLPCADGLECTHGVCSLIEETGDEAPPSACGWNPAASWYDCGFQGADPDGEFSRACPANLEPDTACPASLPFEGCCDAQGNVWYCEEGMVVSTQC
jgi:hypothetical protein